MLNVSGRLEESTFALSKITLASFNPKLSPAQGAASKALCNCFRGFLKTPFIKVKKSGISANGTSGSERSSKYKTEETTDGGGGKSFWQNIK